jgi:hypothetical protein
MTEIIYDAPPTCADFMQSEAFIRLIAGPVGSGKTTACLFELFRRSCEQAPAPDGYRYTRFAILRQTLTQLKSTVLKDIVQWLKGVAQFKVSDNTVYVQIGDVRSEWILIPLEDIEDQRRLLSSQLTGAWISECIEIDIQLVDAIAGRCGRYPSAAQGGCSWFGVIADTNMPSEGSPWYKSMELEVPIDWQVFIQPGGLTDVAENLNWLTQTAESLKLPIDHPVRIAQGRKYYERLARSNNEDWVRRYVHAQYGNDPSGTAVWRGSFRQSFHCVDELTPVNGHPLIIGQDFGRDPCAIITQVDHRGRWLILEEIVVEDMGLQLALTSHLRPSIMQPRYLGKMAVIVGDPAGRQRSTLYEETSFDVVKRAGFQAYPAPTNDIDPRLRAVESWLLRQVDGAGAMLIDKKRCPRLVQAMNGGYRYAKTKQGQSKPTPEKNEFSHIADALQYAALVTHAGITGMIMNRLSRPKAAVDRRRVSSAAWT